LHRHVRRAGVGLLHEAQGKAGPWPYAAYHASRIGIYAGVGLVAALLGTVLVASGMTGLAQGVLQILAGALVILLGLDLLGVSPIRNIYGFAPMAWLSRQFDSRAKRPGARRRHQRRDQRPDALLDDHGHGGQGHHRASPPEGMLLMLAFGAGTLPSMLFASVLFGKLGPQLRGGLQKLAALFVIALGVATLWQGVRFYLVMYRLVV
jgi:sulfite exporter TauE/SafE